MTKKDALLSTKSKRSSSKPIIKNYVDDDGYKVLEYIVPGEHSVLKIGNKEISYSYNSKTTRRSKLSSVQYNKLMKEFDYKAEQLNMEMDSLDHSFEEYFDNSFYCDHNYPKNTTHIDMGDSNCGCGCCLILSIFLLAIICAILYGMGLLGMNIIEFFKSLF